MQRCAFTGRTCLRTAKHSCRVLMRRRLLFAHLHRHVCVQMHFGQVHHAMRPLAQLH